MLSQKRDGLVKIEQNGKDIEVDCHKEKYQCDEGVVRQISQV